MLAQLAAAANMGDGIDKAAIQQAQAAAAEVGIDAGAVGAIAVNQQRILPLAEVFSVIDQRDGNLYAVARLDPQMFAAVLAGIKAVDLRLLEHPPFTGIHIQLKQRIRRRHRRVAVA